MTAPIRLSVATLLALGLATAANAQQTTLHLGHNTQTNHPIHIALEAFSERVAEATGGEINIIVYPAEQLAALRAGVEGVQLGTVDAYMGDSGTIGNWAPHLSFVSLPFMFADFDSAVEIMDGMADDIKASLRSELNVERLGWSPGGFRVIMTTNRPVASAADMEGLRIRVPEIPVYVAAFAALRTNATPLPWGDVYSALQTGVVEGVEGPAAAIQTAGFHEVSSYMSRTNHIMNDLNLLMNLDRFNALSAEHQQIIRDAAHLSIEVELRAVMRDNEDVAYDALSESVAANDTPDVDSFRAAMLPVYDDFIATAGPQAAEWIARVQGR